LELSFLSSAEIRMVTRAPIAGVINFVGRNKGILRTHMMAWNAVPSPAAMQV
jgi:hypothetical protein